MGKKHKIGKGQESLETMNPCNMLAFYLNNLDGLREYFNIGQPTDFVILSFQMNNNLILLTQIMQLNKLNTLGGKSGR